MVSVADAKKNQKTNKLTKRRNRSLSLIFLPFFSRDHNNNVSHHERKKKKSNNFLLLLLHSFWKSSHLDLPQPGVRCVPRQFRQFFFPFRATWLFAEKKDTGKEHKKGRFSCSSYSCGCVTRLTSRGEERDFWFACREVKKKKKALVLFLPLCLSVTCVVYSRISIFLTTFLATTKTIVKPWFTVLKKDRDSITTPQQAKMS